MSACPVIPQLSSQTLIDVIPVAEQIRHDDVVVTVTSLERYSGGFMINLRLDWVGPTGPMPRLIWRATDDHEGQHPCAGCGGSGGGPPYGPDRNPNAARPRSWRMHCPFAYGIPLDAATLTLELESFGLSRAVFEGGREYDVERWESEREIRELGRIVVTLTPPWEEVDVG